MLYYADVLGDIVRVKKGNSYIVLLADRTDDKNEFPDIYLDSAFDLVVSELSGTDEISKRLQGGRNEFFKLLKTPDDASKWIVQKLDGLDWDYPRNHIFLKKSVSDIKASAQNMDATQALNTMTVTQLKYLLREHGGKVESKAGKADVMQAVLALPVEIWQPVACSQIQRWLDDQMLRCRKKMAKWMVTRIVNVAHVWRQRQRIFDI